MGRTQPTSVHTKGSGSGIIIKSKSKSPTLSPKKSLASHISTDKKREGGAFSSPSPDKRNIGRSPPHSPGTARSYSPLSMNNSRTHSPLFRNISRTPSTASPNTGRSPITGRSPNVSRSHSTVSPSISRSHSTVSPAVSRSHSTVSPSISRSHSTVSPSISRSHSTVPPAVSRSHSTVSPAVSRSHSTVSPSVSRPHSPQSQTTKESSSKKKRSVSSKIDKLEQSDKKREKKEKVEVKVKARVEKEEITKKIEDDNEINQSLLDSIPCPLSPSDPFPGCDKPTINRITPFSSPSSSPSHVTIIPLSSPPKRPSSPMTDKNKSNSKRQYTKKTSPPQPSRMSTWFPTSITTSPASPSLTTDRNQTVPYDTASPVSLVRTQQDSQVGEISILSSSPRKFSNENFISSPLTESPGVAGKKQDKSFLRAFSLMGKKKERVRKDISNSNSMEKRHSADVDGQKWALKIPLFNRWSLRNPDRNPSSNSMDGGQKRFLENENEGGRRSPRLSVQDPQSTPIAMKSKGKMRERICPEEDEEEDQDNSDIMMFEKDGEEGSSGNQSPYSFDINATDMIPPSTGDIPSNAIADEEKSKSKSKRNSWKYIGRARIVFQRGKEEDGTGSKNKNKYANAKAYEKIVQSKNATNTVDIIPHPSRNFNKVETLNTEPINEVQDTVVEGGEEVENDGVTRSCKRRKAEKVPSANRNFLDYLKQRPRKVADSVDRMIRRVSIRRGSIGGDDAVKAEKEVEKEGMTTVAEVETEVETDGSFNITEKTDASDSAGTDGENILEVRQLKKIGTSANRSREGNMPIDKKVEKEVVHNGRKNDVEGSVQELEKKEVRVPNKVGENVEEPMVISRIELNKQGVKEVENGREVVVGLHDMSTISDDNEWSEEELLIRAEYEAMEIEEERVRRQLLEEEKEKERRRIIMKEEEEERVRKDLEKTLRMRDEMNSMIRSRDFDEKKINMRVEDDLRIKKEEERMRMEEILRQRMRKEEDDRLKNVLEEEVIRTQQKEEIEAWKKAQMNLNNTIAIESKERRIQKDVQNILYEENVLGIEESESSMKNEKTRKRMRDEDIDRAREDAEDEFWQEREDERIRMIEIAEMEEEMIQLREEELERLYLYDLQIIQEEEEQQILDDEEEEFEFQRQRQRDVEDETEEEREERIRIDAEIAQIRYAQNELEYANGQHDLAHVTLLERYYSPYLQKIFTSAESFVDDIISQGVEDNIRNSVNNSLRNSLNNSVSNSARSSVRLSKMENQKDGNNEVFSSMDGNSEEMLNNKLLLIEARRREHEQKLNGRIEVENAAKEVVPRQHFLLSENEEEICSTPSQRDNANRTVVPRNKPKLIDHNNSNNNNNNENNLNMCSTSSSTSSSVVYLQIDNNSITDRVYKANQDFEKEKENNFHHVDTNNVSTSRNSLPLSLPLSPPRTSSSYQSSFSPMNSINSSVEVGSVKEKEKGKEDFILTPPKLAKTKRSVSFMVPTENGEMRTYSNSNFDSINELSKEEIEKSEELKRKEERERIIKELKDEENELARVIQRWKLEKGRMENMNISDEERSLEACSSPEMKSESKNSLKREDRNEYNGRREGKVEERRMLEERDMNKIQIKEKEKDREEEIHRQSTSSYFPIVSPPRHLQPLSKRLSQSRPHSLPNTLPFLPSHRPTKMGKRVEIVQIKSKENEEIEEIDVQIREKEEKLKTKNSVTKTVSNLLSRMSLRKSSIPSAPTYPLAPHDDDSETLTVMAVTNAAQPTQKYLERMEEKGQEDSRAGGGVGVGVGEMKKVREREGEGEAEIKGGIEKEVEIKRVGEGQEGREGQGQGEGEGEIKKERETITWKKKERDREREEKSEKEDEDIIDGELIESWTDDELLIRAEYEATDEEKTEGKLPESPTVMAKPKIVINQQDGILLVNNNQSGDLR